MPGFFSSATSRSISSTCQYAWLALDVPASPRDRGNTLIRVQRDFRLHEVAMLKADGQVSVVENDR